MRFTAASVALFAGAAFAAVPQYPQAPEYVTSTLEVTITSCAPEVTDCPGSATPYPTVAPTELPSYSTEIVTVTDCPPEVSDCPGSAVPTAPYPTGTGVSPQPTGSSEVPPYPTGGEGPSTSVVTYTTCVPTVTSSTITFYPTTTAEPTGVMPTGTGAPVPPYPTSEVPPPFTGAASSFGASYAIAGLAAVAALFMA